MTDKLQPIKGFRDFYPADQAFQNWLKDCWLSLGKTYGYQEYEGPLMEPIELYESKTSQEIIEKQTFRFTDKDKNYVLRPELTPTLARMIAQRQYRLNLPVRWQSYGRFFRYETPQKGRGRSFFQWNIDILGSETIQADAEILIIACLALKRLGLTSQEVKIKVNDRQFLEKSIISKLDIAVDEVKTFFSYIDKLDKMPDKDWQEWLVEDGVAEGKAQKLLSLVNSQEEQLPSRLQEIFARVEQAGLSDYVEFDKKLSRGLDYYTGIVFEAWSCSSSLRRALFGGGRYDDLTQQVGGKKKIPGVGFAVGDMPILELLKELGKMPELDVYPTQALVTIFSSDQEELSIKTAEKLRQSGINVEVYPDNQERLDNQLDYANEKGIPWVVIIGSEEAEEGVVALKNMSSGQQEKLAPKDLVVRLSE